MPAAEREQSARERRCALGRREHLQHFAARIGARVDSTNRELAVCTEREQDVVEIVSDSAGEAGDRLEGVVVRDRGPVGLHPG